MTSKNRTESIRAAFRAPALQPAVEAADAVCTGDDCAIDGPPAPALAEPSTRVSFARLPEMMIVPAPGTDGELGASCTIDEDGTTTCS